ncbi:polysaccharide pyruvyl transferase family protein [Paenibacillus glycinis]|uniref:Exopolysaccharide biosynthesis protein n=1 Tax=Paenibacillus glycinis TaxID=2697035 RepID=A0ABW9XM27_9BACL|nr:polysaccharide pyruvyl transferase family protein [Paenibacillus glycinis]NBD23598.1 exopolysaccharide biosynthesis protein [Paenibacillus glycinis]
MTTLQFAHPMDELKNKLLHILNVIPPQSKIYYIDYPVYGNGGDLLIMKGTEAFFKDNRIQVQARYSVLDFPNGLAIPKDKIIVLNGGGNFGDLYPTHQKLREKIVNDYPDNRVVILPQTIFYKNETELDRTAAVFNRHKDLHLFVRDTLSQELAQTKFKTCHVYLSPDMAHQLWPIHSNYAPEKDLLCFLRTDIEKTVEQERFESSDQGDYLDWATLFNKTEQKGILLFRKLLKISGGNSLLSKCWGMYTDYLVNKAVNRFGNYNTVQTSRLHGHILSCLMDKPNVLLDNSYGKNGNYYSAWTKGIASAKLAGSTGE